MTNWNEHPPVMYWVPKDNRPRDPHWHVSYVPVTGEWIVGRLSGGWIDAGCIDDELCVNSFHSPNFDEALEAFRKLVEDKE